VQAVELSEHMLSALGNRFLCELARSVSRSRRIIGTGFYRPSILSRLTVYLHSVGHNLKFLKRREYVS